MAKQRIAFFDVDGTIFRWSLEISLMDELMRRKIVPRRAFLLSQGLRMRWKAREASYEEFSDAFVADITTGALDDVSVAEMVEVAKDVVEQLGRNVYVFTRELIATLKESDYLLVAVSGSRREIVEIFAQRFGFDRIVATEYARAGDRITGRVVSWPGADKGQVVRETLATCGLSAGSALAVGDTAQDLPMLEACFHAIAFNPSLKMERVIRRQTAEDTFHPPRGIVSERKDNVRIGRFTSDGNGRARFGECPLREILPHDVATRLALRLGQAYWAFDH